MASGYGFKPRFTGLIAVMFSLTPCLLVIFAQQMCICSEESKRTKANVLITFDANTLYTYVKKVVNKMASHKPFYLDDVLNYHSQDKKLV